MVKKTDNKAGANVAKAGEPEEAKPGSTTAAASTDEPSKEQKQAIEDERKLGQKIGSMPTTSNVEPPAGEEVPAERINYDPALEANPTEEEKGAVTNKFGTQGFGRPGGDKTDKEG